METLFLDTNVIIDLLGERDAFFEPIAKITSLAENKKLTLVLSALSFSTVSYVLTKKYNSKIALDKLRKFRVLSKVSNNNQLIVDKALHSDFKDFEDALQYYSALDFGCDIIITRNAKDFKSSTLPVLSPLEYLSRISFQP